MSRPKRIITEQELQKICNDYISGVSINSLQKENKLQKYVLKALLNSAGIQVLSAYETQKKTGGLEEKNFFDELNELQCYVLGTIFGDGCVFYDPIKYKYAMTIVSNDIDILQSANILFGGNFPISKRKTSNAFNLCINSKHLCEELISKFKLKSPKSSNLIFPNLPLKMYSFFISGLLSTDGCVEVSKKYIGNPCAITFSYSSNCLEFIKQLQDHLTKELNLTETKIKSNKMKRKNINYIMRYTGNQATIILNYIYNNTNELTRCKRKYDIFQNHLTNVSNSII